jgi:cytochrome c
MVKKAALVLLTLVAAASAQNGKTLLEQKCASCHMLQTPGFYQLQKLTAPPMDAVVFHVKLAKKDTEAQKAFIVDYVLNPDVSKSVCESNKVAKYGVMPSQKGNVTPQELEKIASFMLEEYPRQHFVTMIKEVQQNDVINALKSSPFLINNEGLPHLTKLLIKHWYKGALGLTPEQKEKLLKIRKETLSAVKPIKEQIKELENEVIEAMIDRESPASVETQLKKIADLKRKATEIHLKCISDTTSVLTDTQIEWLLPFWQ